MTSANSFGSNLVFGGIAGVIGTTTVFPLDMVKTRLQNQRVEAGVKPYNGVVDCFKKIVKAEGPKGLYSGLGPNLIGVAPEKAIKLSANDYFRATFARMYFGVEGKEGQLPIWIGALSGACAGICQLVATNPMEITKIRKQLQSTLPVEQRKTTIGIVKELGLSGLYHGSAATLLRDIPFSMIYFSLFSKFKEMQKKEDGSLPFFNVLLSALTAGVIASASVTPCDVIKTRMQAKGGDKLYSGVADCARKVYTAEGAPAFFKGVVPRVLIISPLFGITMLIYEVQKYFMTK